MKAATANAMKPPLYYMTLPARQNARRAFWRRVRAVGRFVVAVMSWSLLAALAAFGAVALGAKMFHFLVTP